MTLEKEKRLVIEWMGFPHVSVSPGSNYFYTSGNINKDRVFVKDWNPQDNDKSTCKQWQEIWEKMTIELGDKYYENLTKTLPYAPIKYELRIHTAKPAICWKALIQTLEDK